MSKVITSTTLYPHPFSKAYWKDALQEMKSTKMLVVTALMIALRVALKPFAIYIAPQLAIQTAMLATALGAMIFGPVVAIPAAMVSDTIGFFLFPTGDYFLPFMLTEIASTVIYSLLLYRARVSPIRVTLARFLICLLVNVLLQPVIYAWQLAYQGNPDKAVKELVNITNYMRIFKNLCFFPIESVVLSLFLKYVIPVARRAKLVYCSDENMKFTKGAVLTLVGLMVFGVLASGLYLHERFETTSRSSDYSTEERMEYNKQMDGIIHEQTDDWDGLTTITVVDSAYRGLFASDTYYTVSVYVLDESEFKANQLEAQKEGSTYDMDTLWGYSKSKPKNDDALTKVGEFTFTMNEDTQEISDFVSVPLA